jgi:hypothetical protein
MWNTIRTDAASAAVLAIVVTVLRAGAAPGPQQRPAPDLRGIWETTIDANRDLEGGPESVIVDPGDGKIPYRADARSRKERNAAEPAADPNQKCFLPGVPRATYMPSPFQIFQTPGMVIIVYQNVHAYRIITTDGRPHIDGLPFYMGDSRGRWEGETLVVDVTNFQGSTWLDMTGNYHSEALHVVERYTRTGDAEMIYEATIEDPEVFTSPWTIRIPLGRHTSPDAELIEDQCIEGENGSRRHILPFRTP